ncbi:MAG TPA: hypothetical protein VFJ82_21355 [Longimicrobium sp.]|nr:hypothetical protein [Longimicrobium sp.]
MKQIDRSLPGEEGVHREDTGGTEEIFTRTRKRNGAGPSMEPRSEASSSPGSVRPQSVESLSVVPPKEIADPDENDEALFAGMRAAAAVYRRRRKQ